MKTRIDLSQASVAELHHAMRHGGLTGSALTGHFLTRIVALDQHGPRLRAVIELNHDAHAIAMRADRLAQTVPRSRPLHGIPVLIKDNIDTGDSMLTTAGSLALMNSHARRDAFVVGRLRAAGAVVIGKANLSEWANFRGRKSTSGWSARGGQTRNPYALDHNPGGSSSGSAVAVAAGLTTLAIGTETAGSIVSPASANGVVGIKPTVGLVSRSGVIPIAASFDTPGPLARTVADAAALLTVLAGYDPDDRATAHWQGRMPVDYSLALRRDSLGHARIGVLRQSAGFDARVDALFEHALRVLRAEGAIIVDPANIPTRDDFGPNPILLYEFKDGIDRYLAAREGDGPKSLADLIAFNDAHRELEMPYFGQELFIAAQAKGSLQEPEYLEAHQRILERAGPLGIDAALRRDGLDALVAPTRGPAWITDLAAGDGAHGGHASIAPAYAGYPHITVPMGQVQGLPVGLSLIGTCWSEAALIGYAYAFEQATQARQALVLATGLC